MDSRLRGNDNFVPGLPRRIHIGRLVAQLFRGGGVVLQGPDAAKHGLRITKNS